MTIVLVVGPSWVLLTTVAPVSFRRTRITARRVSWSARAPACCQVTSIPGVGITAFGALPGLAERLIGLAGTNVLTRSSEVIGPHPTAPLRERGPHARAVTR